MTKDAPDKAVNYVQKGCFNERKHTIFSPALPWSFLIMNAKIKAARFHGFGVMKETHTVHCNAREPLVGSSGSFGVLKFLGN